MKINNPGYDQVLRAPTKTIAFTGAAGLGQVASPVTIWTITGRVLLLHGTAFCTETVVSTGGTGTIALGSASNTGRLISALTVGVGTLAVNEWWSPANTQAGVEYEWGSTTSGNGVGWGVAENIIITVATNAITDGTLVFDCWYLPITVGAILT